MGDSNQTPQSNSHRDVTQDPSSVYYIHPSDYTGLKLVTSNFGGNNYSEWKKALLIGLKAKNKRCFIDGSLVAPSVESELYTVWERCDSMVVGWIIATLEPDIARSCLIFNTAREIWQNLEDRFGHSSSTQLYSLQHEIADLHQGNLSIAEYFTKMKTLWDEYDTLCPLPCCGCGNCSCALASKFLKMQQDQRLLMFLMKLNKVYAGVRTNILMMNPLPNLPKAYSILIQEQKHKELSELSENSSNQMVACVADKRKFDARGSYSGTSRNQPYSRNTSAGSSAYNNSTVPKNVYRRPFCDFCKIYGHTKETCYKLHGYPPRDGKPQFKKYAAAVHSDGAEGQDDIQADVPTSCSVPSFNQEQYQQLLALIQSSNGPSQDSTALVAGGLDHVRVHPRFLHSNATSHKWVLGAFAELLDNALDEVSNGATYVKIDTVYNEKQRSTMLLADQDRNRMLQIQDNGGGMNPDKLRHCMSLGYSAKSKSLNVIGQYGNGFKTSTIRLGSDVIVFTICQATSSSCAMRSIGLLSYTFLTTTGKEDIVVPMINYKKTGNTWPKMLRGSLEDWHLNLETILKWSPFSSEQELLQQFDSMGRQGTKIVIYNLWEDDSGQLELDFGTVSDDIQIRGANRDKRKIAMSKKYPGAKHYLTYQHSLRSYASILYLRLPPGYFRIILRGVDVAHHSLLNDMMFHKKICYKPVPITDGTVKDSSIALHKNMQALVTMGFVKGAADHIDIQGFSVYHKNRLIKPFWRVWNAAGSDGRGVIGVLEANFVEPAHDKQGFEKTTALSRLEARLVFLQKSYWRDNCHEIGYSRRRKVVNKDTALVPALSNRGRSIMSIKGCSSSNILDANASEIPENTQRNTNNNLSIECMREDETALVEPPLPTTQSSIHSNNKGKQTVDNEQTSLDVKIVDVMKLRKEIFELKRRLHESTVAGQQTSKELQFEKDKNKSLETQLAEAKKKIEDNDKDQEALIALFQEERERRDIEEEKLRKRVTDASNTMDNLFKTVRELKSIKLPNKRK